MQSTNTINKNIQALNLLCIICFSIINFFVEHLSTSQQNKFYRKNKCMYRGGE